MLNGNVDASLPMSSMDYENLPKVIRNYNVRNLEGEILTLIESLGFDEKREKAVKRQFQDKIWNMWHQEIYDNPEIQQRLKKMYDEWEKDMPVNSMPTLTK